MYCHNTPAMNETVLAVSNNLSHARPTVAFFFTCWYFNDFDHQTWSCLMIQYWVVSPTLCNSLTHCRGELTHFLSCVSRQIWSGLPKYPDSSQKLGSRYGFRSVFLILVMKSQSVVDNSPSRNIPQDPVLIPDVRPIFTLRGFTNWTQPYFTSSCPQRPFHRRPACFASAGNPTVCDPTRGGHSGNPSRRYLPYIRPM